VESVLFLSVAFAASLSLAFPPVETGVLTPKSKALPLTVPLNGAQDLYLYADFGNDSYSHDQAVWLEPVLIADDGTETRLTTLKPASYRSGYGQLITDKNLGGKPLTVAGETFAFGFWAHAPSALHFALGGRYRTLRLKVGIEQGAAAAGSSAFHISSEPPVFPAEQAYNRTPPPPVVPSAQNAGLAFFPDAAQPLLARGIAEILFIRRPTYTSSHVYTEYVDSRWLPGGGLCALDLRTGHVREIIPEFTRSGTVGSFDLSFDAKRIVFDFKPAPLEGYRIYEVSTDGTGLRQLTRPPDDEPALIARYRRNSGIYHHGTDDLAPCYLPDGGIAFVSTRCQLSVLCDSGDTFTVKNLHRIEADGSGLRPLSFSPLSEATPAVLPDGRILYHRWEYVDKAAGNAKALWAVNPDGSGAAEVYGNSISFPETKLQARPVPGAPNLIAMLGASHWHNSAIGSIALVDTAKPIRAPASMHYVTADTTALGHSGFDYRDDDGTFKHDESGEKCRLFRNPYPLAADLFLTAFKPKGIPWNAPAGYGLALVDGAGAAAPLLSDPSCSLWSPYPAAPRGTPPVPPATAPDHALAARGLARAVVTDVYTGLGSVPRGAVKWLRILEQVPRPWQARKPDNKDNAGMAHSAVGNGLLSVKVQHGVVPVEADGSAHFLVPAGRAVYLQALDADCRAVQTERTFVNYLPGETRSCTGCHETPDMAPAPRLSAPLALRRPPSEPAPQPGQPDAGVTFDYARTIQPILDRHCAACHASDTPKAGLDLRGTAEGTYSRSYNALLRVARDNQKRLLGNRATRNEDAASNDISYLPPLRTGALSAPLAALIGAVPPASVAAFDASAAAYAAALAGKHEAAKLALSPAEKLAVANWLDVNCPFHPSYWGRFNVKFADAPDYRPEITFDEARALTPPARPAVAAAP
jgi:hypothetical protein